MTSVPATVGITILVARFLGTCDSVTTCECCGRKNLKHTVALLPAGADTEVYFGTTCASRALRLTVKEVRDGTRAADRERERQVERERQELSRIEHARWRGYLERESVKVPRRSSEIVDMIEALGGYAVARAAYLASVGE